MKTKIAAICTLATLAAPAFAQDGDAESGERVFNRCKACHQIVDDAGEVIVRGGQVGPNLHGMAGGPAGAVEGYRYSDALAQAGEEGLVWDAESFNSYVLAPSEFLSDYLGESVRGKMQAQRLNDAQLADVWAYLAQFGSVEEGS
jgi:cytochrome c